MVSDKRRRHRGIVPLALGLCAALMAGRGPQVNSADIGTMNVTGGDLSISGVTYTNTDAFRITATLDIGNIDLVNRGLLEIAATAGDANTVEIRQVSGTTGKLINEPTGTIDVQSPGTLTIGVEVDNQGTFNIANDLTMNKSPANHSNSGTMNVTGGDLDISGAILTNTGDIEIAPGRTASFTDSTINMGPLATLAGGGVINLCSSTLILNGSYSPETSELHLLDFTITGTGTLINQAGSTMTMRSAAGTGRMDTAMVNEGRLSLFNGSSHLNGRVTNEPTGTIRVEAATLDIGNNDLINRGLLEMVDTTGDAHTVEIRQVSGTTGKLINEPTGTIDVQSPGIRTISVEVDNQGTFNIANDLTMNKLLANHSNSGTMNVTGGDLTVLSYQSFENSSQINAPGGNMTFELATSWTNSGIVKASGGGLTISSVTGMDNSGTIDVTGGDLSISGATLTNTGDIKIAPSRTASFSVSTINMGPLATLAGGGVVNLSSSTLTLDGSYSPETSELNLLDSTSTGAGTLINRAGSRMTMQRVDGTSQINTTMVNYGRLSLFNSSNQLNGSVTNEPTGTIRVEAHPTFGIATLDIGNNDLVNWGLLEMVDTTGDANTVEIRQVSDTTGRLINQPTGTIDVRSPGIRTISVEVDNQGTFNIANNLTMNKSPANHSNSGTMTIAAGTTTIQGSGSLANQPGGVISGVGTLDVSDVTFTSSGAVRPGTMSVGTLTVTGTYNQMAQGSLEVDLGGLAAGTDHDQLLVNGTANLAGTLSGALVNGFVPQLGDSLVILTASAVSGRFDTLDLPLPPTGLDWEVLYNPDNVTLRLAAAQIPGDFAQRANAFPHANPDLVQSPGGRMGINDLPGGVPPTLMPHVADLKTQSIRIGTGRTQLLEAPWPVARVAVNDPEIADIEALTPQQFMVMGNSIGTTDLVFWNEDEEAWRMRVNVVVDVTDLESELQDIFPYADLDLIQSQDVLIVKGELRRAEHAPQLRAILDAYGIKYVDMTTVAGIHQVLLQIRVAEVSREAIRALGINAIHASNDFFGGIRIGPDGPINSVPIVPLAGAPATGDIPFVFGDSGVGAGISLLAGFPGADLVLFFEALAENQYARILAEPSLVALSGEEASFLAGGEFPIPIIQGSSAGGGSTVTIEYKEFGVRLNFRPFVLGDGKIRLYVAPEVSELSDFGAVIIEGFRVPSVLTRRASTTLELRSGQTFAMAGLLKQTNAGRKTRVPVLGDLPVIGPLFRSVRYTQGETELLVLVTASLVEPLSLADAGHLPGHAHQPPSNWDLFINGKLEAPTPSALAPPDAERARQLGLDRLKGPGAWVTHEQPRVISTTGDWTQLK